ncbi:hypothetical protein NQ315_006612 [Exocentrus adspersus]|uniref:Peptidase S1 domain-containing protein n=1 Tax=Exocentrus adspersus TaxID=1586481 RepID=A0AAV8VE04_9CUCU|nr:hypothetical protein NQ315_006612 [Exocentrus adspersus]
MGLRILFMCLAIAALGKAHKIPSVGIENGKEAKPHSRPYQVGLSIPVSNGKRLCGGSLISEQIVLTAANCLKGRTDPVEIILGAHNITNPDEDGQVRINSSSIKIHPDWVQGRPINDIALIKLPEPVELGDFIQTIKLSQDNSTNYEGQDAVISGWGWFSDYFRENSAVLMETTLTIKSNFACEVNYLGNIDDNNICVTGDYGKTACVGDNGSPLVIDDTQVGIFSRKSVLRCDENWPMAYVRVAGFLDWIDSNSDSSIV